MSSDLEGLAKRVEVVSADEQAAILCSAWDALGPMMRWSSEQASRFAKMIDAEAYESAALLLVPEGWWLAGLNYCPSDFRSEQDREWHAEIAGSITWAVIDRECGEEPQYECEGGNAATPALALCAAALRAQKGD